MSCSVERLVSLLKTTLHKTPKTNERYSATDARARKQPYESEDGKETELWTQTPEERQGGGIHK